MCLLCSCSYILSSDIQLQWGNDGYIESVIYNKDNYTVWSTRQENYTFYKLKPEERIGYINALGVFYKAKNPDFGTTLRWTTLGLDDHTVLTYIFPQGTEIPDVNEVAIEDICFVRSPLPVNGLMPFSNDSELISDKNTYILRTSQWNTSGRAKTLGDILDFDSFVSKENICDEYKYMSDVIVASVIFTLKDYDSFVAGSYNVVEYDNRIYIQITKNTYETYPNTNLYMVKEEYQGLFKNAIAKYLE